MHRNMQENELGDILVDEFEVGIASQVRDVIDRASDKIVDADDLMAACQQQVRQVRAQKPGGAGNDAGGLNGQAR